ncbi:MAG TPA: SurA N-terminal domain-containing protein [Vicinamibacterales bacterium]|jgi:peptidyl-prolyl cis-trans isomerase SurA|nr:SurA N-terminal domain-containing protein [Vicinamibacterales bacterium]
MITTRSFRRRRLSLLVTVVTGLALAGACARSQAPSSLSSDVWAVVDGHEIHRAEVEQAYRASVDPTPTPPSAEEMLGLELNVLDELIAQDILLARASAAHIDVADADVTKAVTERQNGLTDAAFQMQLAERGLTPDDFKNGVRRELIVRKLVDRDVTSKINVTDAEITAYYNAHRDEFNVTEDQYHLAQILVTPAQDQQITNRQHDDATSAADAQRKVTMLMDRLRKGEDFATLAMDYSEDPNSAPRGGDLGFVPASTLERVPPQVKKMVLDTKPGQVSSVTINGATTLLMVVAHEAPGQRELTTPSVHDSIRDNLKSRREQVLHAAYLAEARAGATVVNNLARQIIATNGALPAAAPTPAAAPAPAAPTTPTGR